MSLNDWFDKGITKDAYMNDLDKHREHFKIIYENFEVPAHDQKILEHKSGIRIIALAEVWCGHCMLDVPIMLKIAEAADIPVSLLPRDQHLELMDRYATNGKRYIPIFIFIDENGNEIGKWGPMAPEVIELVNELKKEVPPKDNPNYKEAFRKYADKISDYFTKDDTYWNYTYNDIVKAMP